MMPVIKSSPIVEASNNILEEALAYATNGLTVFPAKPDKAGSYKAKKFSPEGKRWGATKDPDTIRSYWAERPDASLGIPTGEENEIWVWDIDNKTVDGFASHAALMAEHGAPSLFDTTLEADTPTDGRHLFFKHPGPGFKIKNSVSKIAPGIDVRGDGGMVLVAPSVKPGKGAYRWRNKMPIVRAPEWLESLVMDTGSNAKREHADLPPVSIPPPPPDASRVEKALHDEYHRVALTPAGKRNAQLNKSSFALGRFVGAGELDEQKAIQTMVTASKANGSYDEDEDECAETINSGLKAGKASPVATVHGMFGPAVAAQAAVVAAKAAGTASPSIVPDQAPPQLISADTPVPGGANVAAPEEEDEKLTQVTRNDFLAHLEMHQFIHIKTGKLWPAATINNTLPAVEIGTKEVTNSKGETETKPVFQPASKWLNINHGISGLTWAPGHAMLMRDTVIRKSGWIHSPGEWTYNQYLGPTIEHRDGNASPWLDLVRRVFPTDAEHIIQFCAHRVQHPEQKINHGLFLGGGMGIGKDSILVPVVHAVGPWNFNEISPEHLLGQFNGFVKCVVLRISEARDLGDQTRNEFYERIKTLLVVPPPVIPVNEKHLREHHVPNVCGTIITSNHPDALFLPADDRRFYIAWSTLKKEEFAPGYWTALHKWFDNGGNEIVAGYLANMDLSGFDAKAPPSKTQAWKRMVNMSRAPEDAELADAIEKHGNPDAITIAQVLSRAGVALCESLRDKRNSRNIWRRFEDCGYVAVDNPDAKSGFWTVGGTRQVVYTKQKLTDREQLIAATHLAKPPLAIVPPSQILQLPPPPY
jgi:hypothetical protein